jgi:predicted acyl esterase
MNSSVCRVMMGVARLAVLGMTTTLAGAQTDEVKEKPPTQIMAVTFAASALAFGASAFAAGEQGHDVSAITGAPIVMGGPPAPSPATQISEIPDKFVVPKAEKDYLKRVEMIPMRDGVRRHTVIMIPKGAKDAPIILSRTPYSAERHVSNNNPAMDALLPKADIDFARAGYIRVFQDFRGKYGSEGARRGELADRAGACINDGQSDAAD